MVCRQGGEETKLEVLGCSGGIGNGSHYTSAFLIDEDILLDCGTGVTRLSLTDLCRIKHIFLTHAHLDHFASLPFLLDVRSDESHDPVTVYADAETIKLLRNHIFNDLIWPDFTLLPCAERPHLRFSEIRIGSPVHLSGYSITAHPARHTISCVSYSLDDGTSQLFYTGDTAVSTEMLDAINALSNLRYLIIEATFTDQQSELAQRSQHLHPEALASMLDRLECSPQIMITHHKPGNSKQIEAQLARHRPDLKLQHLRSGQIIEF